MKKNFDVIVIGGGAAGMMAAITARDCGKDVLLLERNDILGKKLSITGKGRCNLTNNSDNRNIMNNIPTNNRFMYSALAAFSSYDTMDFFENRLCVPLKTERGNRVFPVSDKATDIVKALSDELRNIGAEIKNSRAKRIIAENGIVTGVETYDGCFEAPSVILATGGCSYPRTGSTGDGYRMAEKLGHSVTPLKGSLVPMETKEDCTSLMGLSLKNVVLNLIDNQSGKTLFSEMGEMLFTHFGISGPLVLSASAYVKESSYKVSIDLKPALDEKKLDARLLRDFEQAKNKQFSNCIRSLAPEKLVGELIERTGIPPEKRVNEITREERKMLISVLKSFTLNVSALRPIEEAIITDGGINIKEIDPKTMQSKLVSGLFFAGEIIDVAAYTGGYNLQIAFSTARLAGINA